jgi:serine/threonine protein kinase
MLLEKNPEDRYSMAQALDHEWLAEPSSQITESQLNRLGGDDVYDFESFSDDEIEHADEVRNGNGDESGDGDWTRPTTASATNFGGDSIRAEGSHESFSQPMGNLCLETPGKTPKDSDSSPSKRKTAFSSGSLTPPPGSPRNRPRKSMRLA